MDVCSRFSRNIGEKVEERETEKEALSVFAVYEDKPLLNSTLIAQYTKTDPVFSKVVMFILEGWPESVMRKKRSNQVSDKKCETKHVKNPSVQSTDASCDEKAEAQDVMEPYFQRRFELYVEQKMKFFSVMAVLQGHL